MSGGSARGIQTNCAMHPITDGHVSPITVVIFTLSMMRGRNGLLFGVNNDHMVEC